VNAYVSFGITVVLGIVLAVLGLAAIYEVATTGRAQDNVVQAIIAVLAILQGYAHIDRTVTVARNGKE
jgi:hydrogenase/urease accessory protein HupE